MVAATRFKDRVVIVTGALGGIGLATAQRFAAERARLVLADLLEMISSDRLSSAIADCQSLGSPETLALRCDVADESQVDAVVDMAMQHFGHIDVIVNVAGLTLFKPIEKLTRDDWERLLGVNLMGCAFFTRRGLQVMAPGSAIVNVSSIHAVQTSPLMAAYAAAKAAVVSLTRSTAIEGKPKGVRANAILPGAIDTPMLWASPNLESGAEQITPEDVGRPQDVAAAVAFLASADAAFMTGAALTIDGGRLAWL